MDDKGRLAIPKRYRDQLPAEPELTLTAGPDGCLILYPTAEWEQVAARLRAMPSFNTMAVWYQRTLIGHADDVRLDKSDRIQISQALREAGKLVKDVKMLGQGNRIEIWAAEQWQKKLEEGLSALAVAPPNADDFRL